MSGLRRSEPSTAVAGDVTSILEEVREDGDRAIVRLTKRFDHADLAPDDLRVEPAEMDAAIGVLEPGGAGWPANGDRERPGGGRGPAS